jgi:hypothetical protein
VSSCSMSARRLRNESVSKEYLWFLSYVSNSFFLKLRFQQIKHLFHFSSLFVNCQFIFEDLHYR